MKKTRLSIEVLASLLGLPFLEVKQKSNELFGNLGIDSLTATRVRGALKPMPTYQVLYGLTIKQIAEKLAPIEKNTTASNREKKHDSAHTPFALTPMQESYVIGANEGCPCQVYTEFDVHNLNIEEFRKAIQLVVNRHPMLHASIVNGTQQAVLPTSSRRPPIQFNLYEGSDLGQRRQECIETLKANPNLHWDIQLSKLDDCTTRIHLLLDMLFIDATSAMLLCREVSNHYRDLVIHGTTTDFPLQEIQFHDYCKQFTAKQVSKKSLNYWKQRCDWIPGPPQLPRLKDTDNQVVNFQRESIKLNSAQWNEIKALACELKVTPNSILISSFSEALRFYSEESEFSITITMSERPVAHNNNFSNVVGEFTNILLCPITNRHGSNITERAISIHNELSEGLEHNDLSGLELVRMLRKHHADPHLSFPVVFTSFLGVVHSDLELFKSSASLHFQQTQTPQVTLDHQVYEINGKLQINWDYDANVYSQNLIKEMLQCFHRLLKNIAMKNHQPVTLPPNLLNIRTEMNQTNHVFELENPLTLHELVLKSASITPTAIAVIDQDVRLTYREMIALSHAIAVRLQDAGVTPGSCVAIVMEKGWEQVVATIGTLLTGAFYLPLNPSHPDDRLHNIISRAECKVALVQDKTIAANRTWHCIQGSPLTSIIKVHIDLAAETSDRNPTSVNIHPDDLAYVIFTSGSTGEPKGVEITHRGAANTCIDINQRFGLQTNTVTFAISSLSFDLSVWDIFGTLAAGGTIVICKPNGTRDPDYWWQQINQHNITVWNTVPTSFEMLIASRPLETDLPIRVALLSGDAISMSMIENAQNLFPDLKIVALGGATEASIWSNFHIITNSSRDLGTELVPYGRALSNQTIHVLDTNFEYRPTGVAGDIYIGGAGLARGYFRDSTLTASKFINCKLLGRLYVTGDLGRYLPNGEIEILGRKDSQVKVGGNRVELAEIESCAEQLPSVQRASVVQLSDAGSRLVGFVTAKGNSAGLIDELRIHIDQNLPDYMIPQTWIILKEIPLTANSKVDMGKLRLLAASQHQEQPNQLLESSSEVALILQLAAQVLNAPVNSLSPTHSLTEQGLSSLFAVQLINLLSKAWNTRLSYTLVFNYPSAVQLAAYYRDRILNSCTDISSNNSTSKPPSSKDISEPIAIISTACRLPGNVTSPEEFWRMLLSGTDCVTDVPSSRFDINEVYDSNPNTVGRSYTRRGAFMEQVESFDHLFFGIPIAEARTMDPQQRMLLEVAYEAFHAAGYNKENLRGSSTGVFIGQMNYDWMTDFDHTADYAGTGVSPAITSNRISFTLDLAGPSLTIDTACSSSLVAVDVAVTKLRSGACRMALAGGVNMILSSQPYVTTSQARMLSIDSRCATFDSTANGIARGEGVGAVVLKRLSDALADGNQILAVIRGTAVNQDGRSASLTAPNGLAQEAVIKQALSVAGLAGHDIDYIECHGTGTPLGDPIEIEALKHVLGKQRNKPVVLGAVKTNIGHLEGAAGIIGLIKTVEVLRHREAPGNVHFKSLNPKIDLDGFSAVIPTKPTTLGHIGDKNTLVAGVSSFGYGGTNAHVILESWHTPTLTQTIPSLWLFTGQGSLVAGAARPLYEANAIFKAALDKYTNLLKDNIDVPLLDLLIQSNDANAQLVQQTQYGQPAIVALQLAQMDMWQERGMKPSIVLGHSIGEFAAAVAAGVMEPETALQLSAIRGRLMSECQPGGMVAVLAPAEQFQQLLPSDIVIAAQNGPTMTVLAGPIESLKLFVKEKLKDIHTTMLPVSHAFHSPLMVSAAQVFRDHVKTIKLSKPQDIQFVSTMTGEIETDQLCTADYWADQIVRPVQFMHAIKTAFSLSSPPEKIVEVGPSSTLINMAKRIVSEEQLEWIASSEALKNTSIRRSLFKHVPLAWNKPVAQKGNSKTQPLVEEATPTNCVYELQWITLPPSSSADVDIDKQNLLLSSTPIKAKLPLNWQSAAPESDEELLSLLTNKHWSTVALLSAGSESDVERGLNLLKLASNQALHIEQVVFVTSPASDADAGLWGLARTFRLERPDIRLRSVECSLDSLQQAISLASNHAIEDELSISKEGSVRVPRLRRCNDIGSVNSLSIQPDATYIISGGQGALGLVVAKLLVERGAKHLLLLSRTPKSPDSIPEIVELQKQAQVECLTCDVSQEQSVIDARSWLEMNKWPAVRGIVHTAGVLTDGTIPNQSADKLRLAFQSKVHGARNLRAIFTPPDFMVLFSSAAATFGSPGQASYAAANATLDALAQNWVLAGENVLSVQWGAWADSGMAVRHDAVKRAEAAGFGTISNALGSSVLELLLSAGKRGTVCVSPIDWNRLMIDTPLVSRFRVKNKTALNTQRNGAATHTPAELLAIVREAVAEVIGRPIADDVPLMENGLDSLGSVSLRNQLASRLGAEISSAFVFEFPDVNAMVGHLSTSVAKTPSRSASASFASDLPVLVIGAGIGGIGFARQLEKLGTSVVVMERADRVGGVWHSLANASSKLQIDSPAYDFDSTSIPFTGDHSWQTTFPLQSEILSDCKSISDALIGPVHLRTHVQNIRKISDAEYEVTYQCDGRQQLMRVSGVAAMTGGLHRPRQHTFPKEHLFEGHIGLGIANDTPLQLFKDSSVVIIGHGAFAVENMRTALENGAKHVTILCRRRQLVLSTFCNWILNSSKGVMPVTDVVDIMRPFYKACGVEIEELLSLTPDKNGELMMDQTTVPAGSDIYFLAQILGKLDIIIGEATDFTANSVITQDGQQIQADIFLKCLGSDTDDSVLLNIFGNNSNIQGLWINGDPNLITYNDGGQVPRKVKTLMCSSYSFFVQSFAPAYLHFRQNPDAFSGALSRINTESSTTTNAERILIELWDFVEPAKRILAERTIERCPFDRFQVEREAEWENYSRILGSTGKKGKSLWQLLHPALSLMHRRNPHTPTEIRNQHESLGSLSIFVPRRRRVLFLPGQGTNARLARALLERTGWIGRSNLDFVVPDAPYEMPAFTNEEQLKQIGLDGLVSVGLYDKTARYREWRAGFEALYEHHHYNKPIEITTKDRQLWEGTLSYVREITQCYGPFDGIAGFCEGAAVASAALHLQAQGEDYGLGSVRFFVAMSPWQSPIHQQNGKLHPEQQLQLPMLQIVGDNDMDVFLAAAPYFRKDFADAYEFRHNGQHVYPPLTPSLENKLRQLLNKSDEGLY